MERISAAVLILLYSALEDDAAAARVAISFASFQARSSSSLSLVPTLMAGPGPSRSLRFALGFNRLMALRLLRMACFSLLAEDMADAAAAEVEGEDGMGGVTEARPAAAAVAAAEEAGTGGEGKG